MDKMPEDICAFCKYCYLHGVMGFDGQSTRCELTGNDVDSFDSCEHFTKQEVK